MNEDVLVQSTIQHVAGFSLLIITLFYAVSIFQYVNAGAIITIFEAYQLSSPLFSRGALFSFPPRESCQVTVNSSTGKSGWYKLVT